MSESSLFLCHHTKKLKMIPIEIPIMIQGVEKEYFTRARHEDMISERYE